LHEIPKFLELELRVLSFKKKTIETGMAGSLGK
jgi:hypothetical protein